LHFDPAQAGCRGDNENITQTKRSLRLGEIAASDMPAGKTTLPRAHLDTAAGIESAQESERRIHPAARRNEKRAAD
jgi:hypothetical protein